jgi:iron complex outermembrane receptor protein
MSRIHANSRKYAAMLSGVAFIAATVPAFAQSVQAADTAAPQEAVAQESGSDNDIVVTARKRSETTFEVPIAVSAFNSKTIQDRLAQSVSELAQFTPGFQMQEAFGRSGDRPVIRGASNILLSDGKVGIYLDGAPYLGDFSSLELANVERVEVIKGPQSAIFGRGSLSGAINVILKRPGDHLEGTVSASYGDYQRREFSASISTPITSWLGVQGGVKLFDIHGQYKNDAIPGERLGDQNTKQYTAGIFLTPSADISASVRWLHQDDDDGLYAIGLQPSTQNNCYLTTRPYYCGVIKSPSSYALNSNRLQRPGLYRNADRFIGEASWDIARSGYQLTFQTSHSDQIQVTGTDQSYDGREFYLLGSPFVCANYVPIGNQLCTQSGFNSTDGQHRVTQTNELRITSPSTDRFRWRLGAFTSVDRITPMKQYLEASELGLDVLADLRRVQNNALFGGVDYNVTDKLTVGAELRHQIDKVSNETLSYRAGDVFSPAYLAGLTLPNPNQIIGVAGVRSATFKATLPRFTANWRIDRDLSVYAQYSQGNSPGGFNPITAPVSTYKEEKLINYEVGFKTSKLGFDYLNVSAFWQDYKNQVLTNTYQTGNVIDSYSVNIGRTRIRGLEVEGAYPIIRNMLKVQFNYTFLDAKIRNGIEPEQAVLLLGTACKVGTVTDLDLPGCRAAASIAGNRPPLVSKHSGTIGLRLNHAVTDEWELFSGADVIYRSSFFDQVMNLAESGNSTRVNLQIGVHDAHGLRITLYGKNVLNDKTPVGILRYIDLGVGVAKSPSGDSSRAFAITPPRKPEVGLIVSKTF